VKLTVLGGAAACPNPGQGSSSYVLEGRRTRLLLDCGPNTISELRRHVELNEIDAIIISHVHADHTLDLVPYRYGLKYMPGLASRTVDLWAPPDSAKFFERVACAFAMAGEGPETFFTDVFTVAEYSDETPLEIGEFRIEFFRTNHPVPCWAQRISSPDGLFVYLADSGPQANLVDIARGADIFVAEGTLIDTAGFPDDDHRLHITAFEAGSIAREAGVKHFVLTHLWSAIGFDRYCAEAKQGFGGDLVIAKPGLVVEI
jgi:ribonuclease BN (tRNA processing enzyme)